MVPLGLGDLFGPAWVTFGCGVKAEFSNGLRRRSAEAPSYLCERNRIDGRGSCQLPVLTLGRQRRRRNQRLRQLLTLRFLGRLDGTAVFLGPQALQGEDADSRPPAVHHIVQLSPPVDLETGRRCLFVSYREHRRGWMEAPFPP